MIMPTNGSLGRIDAAQEILENSERKSDFGGSVRQYLTTGPHNHCHFAQCPNILQGILFNDDKIGFLAGFQSSDLVAHPYCFRSFTRSRSYYVHVGHACMRM